MRGEVCFFLNGLTNQKRVDNLPAILEHTVLRSQKTLSRQRLACGCYLADNSISLGLPSSYRPSRCAAWECSLGAVRTTLLPPTFLFLCVCLSQSPNKRLFYQIFARAWFEAGWSSGSRCTKPWRVRLFRDFLLRDEKWEVGSTVHLRRS